ncbi:hypothetical protein PILCRDRAFT_92801 [Piloderma croceum F 1598]|uniref:Uncharacterized protein n=1 Tax=Piloderma croceum (strain F 1598) TaxID=765440 RepID=A0A0C3EMZ3_PILCF|nr:hypothetical protein PILCRDRAFT_92801 [Piloderma croceum F 1598]
MPAYLDRFGVRDQKAAGDQFNPAAALQAEVTTRTLLNISSTFNTPSVSRPKCDTSGVEHGSKPGIGGYQPPVKETPGSGLALAVQLNLGGIPLPQQLALLQANAIAGMGQVPPFYNVDIDAYQHRDLLRLIKFYNNNFGIILSDSLPTRKQKFHLWMTL